MSTLYPKLVTSGLLLVGLCMAVFIGFTVRAALFDSTDMGQIVIVKETLPANSPQVFTYQASYDPSGFSLRGGQSNSSGPLSPDVYSVSENAVPGWNLDSASCDDGSDPSAINLQAGTEVRCTFSSTQNGHATIQVVTLEDDAVFEFQGDIGASLSNGGSETMEVEPGSYTAIEVVPEGWRLASIVCRDGDSVVDLAGAMATFVIAPGEDVVCTFTNTRTEEAKPTRTSGFWKIHTAFTADALTGHFAEGMSVGAPLAKTITTPAELLGVYYANPNKKTTGEKRSTLDRARLLLAVELVTAELNCAQFGCSGTTRARIAVAQSAYGGTSVSALESATTDLDTFNRSGNTLSITTSPTATPAQSQSVANLAFWNVLP